MLCAAVQSTDASSKRTSSGEPWLGSMADHAMATTPAMAPSSDERTRPGLIAQRTRWHSSCAAAARVVKTLSAAEPMRSQSRLGASAAGGGGSIACMSEADMANKKSSPSPPQRSQSGSAGAAGEGVGSNAEETCVGSVVMEASSCW